MFDRIHELLILYLNFFKMEIPNYYNWSAARQFFFHLPLVKLIKHLITCVA